MLLAVLGEIEDRRQFLADMECLGQDRAYRSQIETEISQVQMLAAPVVLWWICDLQDSPPHSTDTLHYISTLLYRKFASLKLLTGTDAEHCLRQ